MQHTNEIWTFAPQEVLRLAVIHGVPPTVLKNSQGHPVKEGQMRLWKKSVPFVSKWTELTVIKSIYCVIKNQILTGPGLGVIIDPYIWYLFQWDRIPPYKENKHYKIERHAAGIHFKKIACLSTKRNDTIKQTAIQCTSIARSAKNWDVNLSALSKINLKPLYPPPFARLVQI